MQALAGIAASWFGYFVDGLAWVGATISAFGLFAVLMKFDFVRNLFGHQR